MKVFVEESTKESTEKRLFSKIPSSLGRDFDENSKDSLPMLEAL